MTAFPRIDRVPYVVIDTETTGLSWWKDRVFGISIALPGGDSLYWDIRTDPQVIQWLNDLAKDDRVGVWVGHNLKFDYHFLREAGFEMPRDKIDCTMVRGALINEHEPSYSLDFLARKYAKQQKDEEIYEEMAKLFGGRPTRSAQMPNISRAPVHVVAKYAKQDVIATQALYEWQQGEIERQGLHKIHAFERRLMPVIIDMETEGVEVDVELAEKAVRGLTERIDTMQGDLNTLAGFEVNPNPSGSITDLFKPTLGDDNEWYLVDGTKADKTEGGKASINAECLRRMKHPAAKMILDLRKMLKTWLGKTDKELDAGIDLPAVGDSIEVSVGSRNDDDNLYDVALANLLADARDLAVANGRCRGRLDRRGDPSGSRSPARGCCR